MNGQAKQKIHLYLFFQKHIRSLHATTKNEIQLANEDQINKDHLESSTSNVVRDAQPLIEDAPQESTSNILEDVANDEAN